ncbi:TPA: hypothetical protein ACP2TL_005153, partial [Escherichia coli]
CSGSLSSQIKHSPGKPGRFSLLFNQTGVITDAVKTFPHLDSHSDRPFVSCPRPVCKNAANIT